MYSRRSVTAGALAMAGAPALARAQDRFWPGDGAWATVAPDAAGFDRRALRDAVTAALGDNSTSVMVLRGGRIVAEAYGKGGGPDAQQAIQSAGKSMVSVLTGVCLDEGRIKSLDQSASAFVPQWRGTPKEAITIRHLLSMTSGLDDAGLAVRDVAGDQFAINAAAPLKDAPGAVWHYNTPVYHLMFHVVARAAGEPFEAFAQKKLLGPLGMTATTWMTNQGRAADGRAVTNYYTANCTARDLARFGLMALAGGAWNGRQVVSADYLRASVSPSQDLNPAYGYLWWENARPGVSAAGRGEPSHIFGEAPRDTFAALGAGGQDVIVTPSRDLVIVRQGTPPGGAASPKALAETINAAIAA